MLSGLLTFASNDFATPLLSVPVSGTVVLPPTIEVSPTTIDESIRSFNVKTFTLTISNTGASDLDYAIDFRNTTRVAGVGGNSQSVRFLLLAADYTYNNLINARSSLLATGLFEANSIDLLEDPSSLTLADLEPYDAVLVWTNYWFGQRYLLGDVL